MARYGHWRYIRIEDVIRERNRRERLAAEWTRGSPAFEEDEGTPRYLSDEWPEHTWRRVTKYWLQRRVNIFVDKETCLFNGRIRVLS